MRSNCHTPTQTELFPCILFWAELFFEVYRVVFHDKGKHTISRIKVFLAFSQSKISDDFPSNMTFFWAFGSLYFPFQNIHIVSKGMDLSKMLHIRYTSGP
jgi:hypothetical protein